MCLFFFKIIRGKRIDCHIRYSIQEIIDVRLIVTIFVFTEIFTICYKTTSIGISNNHTQKCNANSTNIALRCNFLLFTEHKSDTRSHEQGKSLDCTRGFLPHRCNKICSKLGLDWPRAKSRRRRLFISERKRDANYKCSFFCRCFCRSINLTCDSV